MKTVGVSLLFLAAWVNVAVAEENWDGFYAGFNIGAARGDVSVTNDASQGVNPGPFTYDITMPFAGVNVGFNGQMGAFVLGIEGDLQYGFPNGMGYIPSSNPIYHQDLTIQPGILAEASARAGIGFDSTLLYAKGGAVYYSGGALQQTTKPGYAGTASPGFPGYLVGLGVEQMVSSGVSIKAEYQHMGFAQQKGYQTATVNDGVTPAGTVFPNWTELSMDAVKVGVNFHY